MFWKIGGLFISPVITWNLGNIFKKFLLRSSFSVKFYTLSLNIFQRFSVDFKNIFVQNSSLWLLPFISHYVTDTLKAFGDLKNRQKSLWSKVFWYEKVCIFWMCFHYTIHWDKTKMLKRFNLDKINGAKMPCFFFHDHITVLLLICDSYMSWSTRFVSLKLCLGFSWCSLQ